VTEASLRRLGAYERFRLESPEPGVLVVTMSRPEKLNAMDQLWFAELTRLMRAVGKDGDDHRAVVLTGEGRAFSAGGDIDMFHDLGGDVALVRPHLARVYDAFHAVEKCAVPVVGAVNGIAFGGGTELTLACDIAVAGESARFSFKEASVGLMPGYGIVRGPDVIGRHWTRYLALTGRTVDAAFAERIGLVQEMHPDDVLLEAAVGLAREVADNSPLAVQVGKAFVNRGTETGYPESVEAVALLFGTDEHREAVAAFRSRRP
jgi:enoyl-CoA hydratase/carnithine racemase